MRNEICPRCGKEIEMRAEGECCSHCLADGEWLDENYAKGHAKGTSEVKK